MTDPEDRKLDQLLENINQLRADVEDGFSGLRKDNRTTNERITKQSQTFRDDQNRVINRLDLVAAQVVKVGDDVTEVKGDSLRAHRRIREDRTSSRRRTRSR